LHPAAEAIVPHGFGGGPSGSGDAGDFVLGIERRIVALDGKLISGDLLAAGQIIMPRDDVGI
jgi:hypothetical protein